MKIFKLASDRRYQTLVLKDEADWDIFHSFDGVQRFEGQWKPPIVEVFSDGYDDASLQLGGDFPFLASHVPVFGKRSHELFVDMLNPYGEFLPLESDDGEFHAFNVKAVNGLLDEKSSEVSRFKSSGRIKDITRYHLKEGKLGKSPPAIFKLDEVPLLDVFVSEAFSKIVEENSLKGTLLEGVATS